MVLAFNAGFYNPNSAFLPTLRQFHTGDIVIAVGYGCPTGFFEFLQKFDVIVYDLPMRKLEGSSLVQHYFTTLPVEARNITALPIPILRYFVYQYWIQKYSSSSVVLLSDFRDVFFQRSPFTYMPNLWMKSKASLAVALEVFPNKVIRKCAFNRPWIAQCFGSAGADLIDRQVVSCSGVVMGARDATLIYVSSHTFNFISCDNTYSDSSHFEKS